MNNKLINDIKKYIPEVSPLQQFIAVNPLNDCHNKTFTDLSRLYYKNTGINIQQSMGRFHDAYKQKRISKTDLRHSLRHFLSSNYEHVLKNSCDYDLAQQIMINFIVDRINNTNTYNNQNIKQLFVAHQMRKYYFDDPVADIRNQIYTYLIDFFLSDASNDSMSLFSSWRKMQSDFSRQWRLFLSKLPLDSNDIISHILNKFNAPDTKQEQYLLQISNEIKGWLGFIKWQNKHVKNSNYIKKSSITDVLAIWLCHEYYWYTTKKPEIVSLSKHIKLDFNSRQAKTNNAWEDYLEKISCQTSDFFSAYSKNVLCKINLDHFALVSIWQYAYELSYQSHLNNQLIDAINNDHDKTISDNVDTAWIFCIDPRSEAMRSDIEKQSGHITIGFAGFFGFSFQAEDNTIRSNQCPALLEPAYAVKLHQAIFPIKQTQDWLNKAISTSKASSFASFSLFEMMGIWKSISLWNNSFFHRKKCQQPNDDISKLKIDSNFLENDDDFDKAVLQAESFLKSIAIPKSANNVVICGHGATTTNNPYQSALNCGACGGNSGLPNAIIACYILNNQKIRAILAARNSNNSLPSNLVFIPAFHDTTKNDITVIDHDVSDLAGEDRIKELSTIVHQVSASNNNYQLAETIDKQKYTGRDKNWAELYPELGLVNNASMIVGPRWISKQINLKGRVFLHDYNPENDINSSLLEGILLAPVIVAHWINMQYYFSSVSPDHFGSGNKVLHNVLPNIGVIEGNISDLKIGLPKQSISYQEELLHEPMRLSVFIYAEQDDIDRIVNKHDYLKHLIVGQWLHIKALPVNKEYQARQENRT